MDGFGLKRAVFAKRDFHIGQVICAEVPLVTACVRSGRCDWCVGKLASSDSLVQTSTLSASPRSFTSSTLSESASSILSQSQSTLSHTNYLCKRQCGRERYCSKKCADYSWNTYHSKLCEWDVDMRNVKQDGSKDMIYLAKLAAECAILLENELKSKSKSKSKSKCVAGLEAFCDERAV